MSISLANIHANSRAAHYSIEQPQLHRVMSHWHSFEFNLKILSSSNFLNSERLYKSTMTVECI